MSAARYFTRDALVFLEELAANNDREWFARNKSRYEEHVKVPALRLIEHIAPELERISPHFMATPRSLFRIHRDTRFSKDKSPYKTHTGIQFRHTQSADVHAPGFYFHVQPGSVFAALGIWHPSGPALRGVREHIAEEPATWRRVTRARSFASTFRIEGERLKRVPRGFDPEHPLADDLRLKDYVGWCELPESFLTGPRLPRELGRLYARGSAFLRFLCESVGVPF